MKLVAKEFKVRQETPWKLPAAFEETIERNIDELVEEEGYRFKRNRVYTMKELLLTLIKAAMQGIVQKDEIALYGKEVYEKPYTKQNLEYRLNTLPIEIMRKLLEKVKDGYRKNRWVQAKRTTLSRETGEKFSDIVSVDGTILEQVRLTRGVQKEKGERLKTCGSHKLTSGGHVLVMLSLSNQMITGASYHANALVNDTNFTQEHLSWTQPGSLTVMDRGFFSYGLFKGIIESGADFIIPFRKGTRILKKEILEDTPDYCESLIRIGVKPKLNHTLRMIEYKRFPKNIDEESCRTFLVSVTDSKTLSAEEVIRCYDQRWVIEKCFKQVKQPLCLSHLWSSKPHHIEIQVLSTLIAYLLYNRFRITIANELYTPVQDISIVKGKKLLKALSATTHSQKIVGWVSLFRAIRKLCGQSRHFFVEINHKTKILRQRRERYFQALSRPQAA